MAKTEMPLALVLPDVPDAHDQCISRLAKLIAKRPGISCGHMSAHDSRRCVHFDPASIPLAEVARFVRAAGASLSEAARASHYVHQPS